MAQYHREQGIPFRIFISSKDILVDERAAVEAAIADLNMVPVRVETTTWLATPLSHEYLHQIRQCQLVVLVLAPVDTSIAGANYYQYVKAEIYLAFAEGKKVLLFVRIGKTSAQQDEFLQSVQPRVFACHFTNAIDLLRLTKLSILHELVRQYSSEPFLFTGRRQFYEFITTLIQKTQTRLIISTLTPIFLLGPRKNLYYEQLLYDRILDVVRRSSQPGGPEIVLLYNRGQTENELKYRSDGYNSDRFIDYCQRLQPFVSERCAVAAGPEETIPYVVVDNNFAIGQGFGSSILVTASESVITCNALHGSAKEYAAEPPHQGIEHFLRLVAQWQSDT